MLKQDVLKMTAPDLLKKLDSSENGLSEADAVLHLKTYGLNQFQKANVTWVTIILRQFKGSLIYMLAIASIISYSIRDYSDGTIILVILLLNTLLGFFQEYKSERIIEKLSQLISRHAWLKRDNKIISIEESQIVPGDIIILRQGDVASVDLRLLHIDNLQVDQSQLTGESLPVAKSVSPDKTHIEDCLVFAGSIIVKGEGTGVVYATANETELGAIATLSTQTKKVTEYEKSLQTFSSFLVRVVVLGLALVFIFKLILDGGIHNLPQLALFIIALAVAVVPEVLPIIATVTLSRAAIMLSKKHVVVKRLSALEDLGNVNLLCTDKTGTLTENKMSIDSITGADLELLQKLLFATITPLKHGQKNSQNSYDNAFAKYISPAIKKEAKTFSIVKELPFDPDDRRRRIVLIDATSKQYYLVVIGAPEILLEIASCSDKRKCLSDIAEKGSNGLHNLGIAYQKIEYTEDFNILKNEKKLIFLGYISLLDKLRATTKKTVLHAKQLGIQLKILTGDSKEVAAYVGREIGLITDDQNKVYQGSDLEAMSEAEFKDAVRSCNVFARVSPAQKYNIVKIAKAENVVAYQGDGINDAPALKMADVAIAVNTATDIARENADIILLDKSLEVIINGIKFGRQIFININKYIKYTMVSNFGNFIALSVLYLFSTNLPILPVQILLTTIITDLPLVTISFDNVADDEVVSPEKHNVKELILFSLILGIPTSLFILFYYMLIRSHPLINIQTSLYVFFTFLALIIFYTVRTKKFFWRGKSIPLIINVAFALAAIFSLGIIYIPVFQTLLNFVPLSLQSLSLMAIIMLVYLTTVDLIKVWYYTPQHNE